MTDKQNNSAFEIDGRIRITIDHDLAFNLGLLVLSTDTKNSALLALAHQLKNLTSKSTSQIKSEEID
jgi:hypothetical protein